MNIIVAVDLNWGIGFNNNLLVYIREDMLFFKKMTMNKTVVMGRKTFESLPNGKPLKNRVNIILSSTFQKSENNETNLIVCKTIEELSRILESYNDDEVFFIGGESIYKMAVGICDRAYVTKIYEKYKTDAYMVNVDKLKNWKKISESYVRTKIGIDVNFVEYIKIK
jgi:dihydrofolate reductase